MCSALSGTAFDPKSVPSDTADKATIVAGLKASFDLCDKAYGALTDANVTEAVSAGPVRELSMTSTGGNLVANSVVRELAMLAAGIPVSLEIRATKGVPSPISTVSTATIAAELSPFSRTIARA